MVYAQQIWEQEAPRLEQRISADIHAIIEKQRGYRKCYMDFDYLERANKPKNATERTSLLGAIAKILLSVIMQKLMKDPCFPVTHKYLTKTTKRKARQNLHIINELRDLFNIEYKRKFEFKGKIYRNCYIFSHRKIENIENPDSRNNSIQDPLQTAELYSLNDSLKNNYTESIRSNGDLIILENPDLEIQNTDEENVDIEKDCYQEEDTQELEFTDKNSGRIFRNGFLGKAKNLNEMQPYLTDSMCSELRRLSDRDFTNKAISEILQDIARKGYEVFFMHIKGFIAYMVKALKNELRDAVKIANENFYIKANKTPEELVEQREQAEMHKHLNQVEQDSITNRSDETQFKARIANKFSPHAAYNFLKNLSLIRKTGGVLELHLTSRCGLTPSEETRLLWEAQSIGGYSDIGKIKFVI